MHIPDGFLDPKMSTGLIGAAVAFLGLCLAKIRSMVTEIMPEKAYAATCKQISNFKKNTKRILTKAGEQKILQMSLVAGFIFAAQMFNFPIEAGTSGHLIGGVLAAVLLGPFAGAVVIGAVLIIQSLFFADGGFFALGANIINMALIGSFLSYYLYVLLSKKFSQEVSIGIAAWASVMLAALACSMEVGLSGIIGLGTVTFAMLKVHALIGIIEAFVTIILVKYFKKIILGEKE
ncbi:MAG: energy-coupling factor ABC transporter permease [Candidatus Margulisiibacteriota bacterium]|jgi:cobalt/nickel transport system permease protein